MTTKDPKEALARSALVIEQPVTWGAMDALGHVNNTVYFRYFEDIRMAYFERTGLWGQSSGMHGIGPILAETRCRFLAPLHYPDKVHIGTWISDIGDDRFTMDYVVVSERLGQIAALGSGVIVCYDYDARKKARLPESVRAILAA